MVTSFSTYFLGDSVKDVEVPRRLTSKILNNFIGIAGWCSGWSYMLELCGRVN